MELLQSTESFSLSWVTNLNHSSRICSRSPSSDSFIVMDLGFISRRWNDFDFIVPESKPTVLVQSDEIFANDLWLPNHLEREEVAESSSIICRVFSLDSSQKFLAQDHWSKSRLKFSPPLSSPYRERKQRLRNRFGSSRKILQKYFFFLMPLFKKVKDLKMIPCKSPTTRVESCCNSSTADSPIYEAILHCKKSFVC